VAILNGAWLDDCTGRELLSWIRVSPIKYGFVTVPRLSSFMTNFSSAMADLAVSRSFAEYKNEFFREGETCGDGDVEDTTPINARMMAGVYIIFAVSGALAVVVAVLLRYNLKSKRADEDKLDPTYTDGELLRALIAKVDRIDERIASPVGNADIATVQIADDPHPTRTRACKPSRARVRLRVVGYEKSPSHPTAEPSSTTSDHV